jgi:hypothetical protein
LREALKDSTLWRPRTVFVAASSNSASSPCKVNWSFCFFVFIGRTKNAVLNEARRLILRQHDLSTVSLRTALCLFVAPADSWSAQTTGEFPLRQEPTGFSHGGAARQLKVVGELFTGGTPRNIPAFLNPFLTLACSEG